MTLENIFKNLGNTFLTLDKGFVFGPQGKLIRRNLEDLWFKYCVAMPPYNVFLSSTDKIMETFDNLQALGVAEKPVGIAVLEEVKNSWNTHIISDQSKLNSHRIGKVMIISDMVDAKDLFHKKQRERKVWWRKFSREPSRFKFLEARKVNKNKDVIDIVAEFELEQIVLETISYVQDTKKYNFQIHQETSHIIEHTASLDWGSLAFLCDAYNPDNTSSSSYQLKLHPKLSPFKVGLHVPAVTESESESSDSKSHEKARLLLYLNNLLKSNGVETVVSSDIKGFDVFQVPLMVTVDDMSLQNGIVYVWNRLTTLAEQVHITSLSKYILSRCS